MTVKLETRIAALCSLLAVAAALLAARAAHAQACTDSEDCAPFETCETFEYELCGIPMCMRGEACEPDPASCQTYTESNCVPAPCGSDADCPAGSVCRAEPYTECSVSACPSDDTDGGCPEMEPVCEDHLGDPVCTPRYRLPCTAAADCGPGFDCEQQELWSCSGGGSAGGTMRPGEILPPDMTPAQDAGAATDAGFECHAELGDAFVCVLQVLPCSSDGDCQGGLECVAGNCAPPGYSDGLPQAGGTADGGVATAPGGPGGMSPADAGVPSDNPADEDEGEDGEHHHRPLPGRFFGCSTSSTQSPDWLGVIALVGLAIAATRRRARG